jgi:hypothetical protein
MKMILDIFATFAGNGTDGCIGDNASNKRKNKARLSTGMVSRF